MIQDLIDQLIEEQHSGDQKISQNADRLLTVIKEFQKPQPTSVPVPAPGTVTQTIVSVPAPVIQ